MQETKLTDSNAPHAVFQSLGCELAHHGQAQWNGVAIASRCGLSDVVTNFGEPLRGDGVDFVAAKLGNEVLRQVLVKQNAHRLKASPAPY